MKKEGIFSRLVLDLNALDKEYSVLSEPLRSRLHHKGFKRGDFKSLMKIRDKILPLTKFTDNDLKYGEQMTIFDFIKPSESATGN